MPKAIETFSAEVEERETLARVPAINERKLMAHEGTPLEAVLDDHESEVCRVFLESMAERDYPNATVLSNKAWIPARRRFMALVLGREMPSEPEPFTIRSYVIGRSNSPVQAIILCEDGRLRAGDWVHSNYQDDGLIRSTHYVHDILLNPATGQLPDITYERPDGSRGWRTFHALEDALLTHIVDLDRPEA